MYMCVSARSPPGPRPVPARSLPGPLGRPRGYKCFFCLPGAAMDICWPPEGSEADCGSLLAPTLRTRVSRTPQNILRGAILEYLLMLLMLVRVARGFVFVVLRGGCSSDLCCDFLGF